MHKVEHFLVLGKDTLVQLELEELKLSLSYIRTVNYTKAVEHKAKAYVFADFLASEFDYYPELCEDGFGAIWNDVNIGLYNLFKAKGGEQIK